jgi:squalene synthase HpnC
MTGENVPVALRVLPARVRGDLGRVYRFARFIDDVGDDPDGIVGNADRTKLLDIVEEELSRLPAATLTPVADMAPLTSDGRVPVQPFIDLVAANRQDQVVTTYASFADLEDYCRLSANPVGRVVLYLAGAATTANIAHSDAVCTALQVLEHCQDVREDALHGRTYLPQDDLNGAGVDSSELTRAPSSPALRAVIGIQVARAGEMLNGGRPLLHNLSGWARLAVAGYMAGGMATAGALERAGYDVGTRTVRPTKKSTAGHAVRLLLAAR